MEVNKQARLLASIGMLHASPELQEGFLYAFERITQQRLGCIVYSMFNAKQVEWLRQMRQTGRSDSEVLAWIKSQMPLSYDDLHDSVLLALFVK